MTDPRPNVCILGSINMDLVLAAPRLPLPGETLLGGRFQRHPGGKGANQAVAAARLGAAVTLIGAIGDDDHGRALRDALAAEGVNLDHLSTRPGLPTGVGLITVAQSAGEHHAQGENTIVVASGANAAVTPDDVAAARPAIAAADVLLLQLELPLETTLAAARTAREAGVTVILNAAPAAQLPDELLDLADVLIANEVEARMLTDHLEADVERIAPDTPDAAAPADPEDGPPAHDILLAKLSALGLRTAVITLGPRGAAYMHADAGRDVPSYPVNAVDSVGAGDAFTAALATRWAEHQIGGHIGSLEVMDAVCWGCAAGALATTTPGAIPSLPRRPEVASLLRTQPA